MFFLFSRNHSELQDDSTEEKTDIVELLEAIAYLICIDELSPDIASLPQKASPKLNTNNSKDKEDKEAKK